MISEEKFIHESFNLLQFSLKEWPMRYIVTFQQRDFYTKHHYVEFEGLLSSEEIDQICQAKAQHPRDLWRTTPEMKKLLLNPRHAEIAAQLLNRKPLRIAYDAASFPPGSYRLEDNSCLQNLSCALLIKLSDAQPTSNILPKHKGSVLFFTPTLVLDWTAIGKTNDFFLIVYGSEKMLYIMQPKDPHVHALKKEGYVFGDLVKDATHPTIYR